VDVLLSELGAAGDALTHDTDFIQKAIDQVAEAGGGRVVFDAGLSFLSGSIQLRAGVELHLEEDSKLIASSSYGDYSPEHAIPVLTEGKVSETVLPTRAFIAGYKANGASITGKGKIIGSADGFIAEPGQYIHKMRGPEGGRSQYLERPFTIFLIDSQNVSLIDFTLEDPAFWAIRLTGCNDCEIDGIQILTDLKVPNADGIDIDRCQRVRIVNCHLVTADDCISLKSCAGTAMYGDVTDVHISGCNMISTSGAITLGTESVGLISNVLVEDCKVTKSHRGFAVRAREGGLIENVTFRNSEIQTRAFSDNWWGHGEALHVTAFRWNEPDHLGDGNTERLLYGSVRNIRFENLDVTTEAGTLVWGQKPGLIEDISFENVRQTMKKQSKWEPRIDLRPNDVEPFVLRKHNAFEIVNSQSVRFKNTKLSYVNKNDFGQEVIHAENSTFSGEVEEIRN